MYNLFLFNTAGTFIQQWKPEVWFNVVLPTMPAPNQDHCSDIFLYCLIIYNEQIGIWLQYLLFTLILYQR